MVKGNKAEHGKKERLFINADLVLNLNFSESRTCLKKDSIWSPKVTYSEG